MSQARYAELQVTSHFSFLRGASSCEELFAQAAMLGIEALAVAWMELHYHNNYVPQFARDELTKARTAEPYWTILRDTKLSKLDRALKEAIEHADEQR